MTGYEFSQSEGYNDDGELICELCDDTEEDAGTLFPRTAGSRICRGCLEKLDAVDGAEAAR